MQYVSMGEVTLSRIVRGFWRLTGPKAGSWNISDEALKEMIAGCLDRGVTTFDAADVYGMGQCEVQLGRVLPAFRREDYQIVTKAGICWNHETMSSYYDTSYDYLVSACHAALERLNCEYIDLFLIHREDPMLDPYEAGWALLDLKKQGLIREAGVSNFDPFKMEGLNRAMDGCLRTNQIELHPCCFEHFNSGMTDYLTANRIRPMIWSPLAGGKLFTSEEEEYVKARAVLEELAEKYGVSPATIVYAWLMQHPMGALPIVGGQSLARLDEAIAALDLHLERPDWYRVYAASGQQKIR